MLGWVERVVPQPPGGSPIHRMMQEGSPGKAALCGQPSGSPCRPAAGTSQGEGSESQGMVSTTTESAAQGVLGWLSQGLGKVIPRPTLNGPGTLPAGAKSFETSFDIPDVTEVQSIKMDDEDFEVTVLETEEEDLSEFLSSSDNNALDKMGGQKVLSWLKEGFGKIIPKPESLKRTEDETAEQALEPEPEPRTPQKPTVAPSPPSATEPKDWDSAASFSSLSLSLFPRSLGGDGGSLYEWFAHGLEKAMPQPVTPTKQAQQKITQAPDMGPGQERCKGA